MKPLINDRILHKIICTQQLVCNATWHSSLLNIAIDFDAGRLFFNVNWQMLIESQEWIDESWYSLHEGNVRLAADLYPAGPLNLDDECGADLIQIAAGNLQGEHGSSLCNSLLLTEKHGENWQISLYLSVN